MAAARSGFRRMFSISAFAPAKQPTPPPKAEPSPQPLRLREENWPGRFVFPVRACGKADSRLALLLARRWRPSRSKKEHRPASTRLQPVTWLSKHTTTEGLKEAFAKFGEVVHARVVTDRVTSFSKGFGFVRYATVEDAAKEIEGMDGKFLDGWVIFAEYARPRPLPQQPETTSQPQQSWGPPSGSWGAQ